MKALGLGWLGIPTERFEPTFAFFRDVMGLEEERLEEDFTIIRLPGGEAVEIFGPSRAGQEQFATGPIVGFRVEDGGGAPGDGGRRGRVHRSGTRRRSGGRLVPLSGTGRQDLRDNADPGRRAPLTTAPGK